jgi:sporulation protein YlmC with PRC-barrel domain
MENMDLLKIELIGKTVMSEEGIPIGIIKKSLRNSVSGEITSILLEPSNDIDISNYKKNNQGRIILPFENISPVQDVIIIEK